MQCHLRIEYIVDSLKRVNLAACRPMRRNSIGPECGPHGTLGKVSVHQSLTWDSQKVTVHMLALANGEKGGHSERTTIREFDDRRPTPNGTCSMSKIHRLPTGNASFVVMRTVLRSELGERTVVLSTFMIALPPELMYASCRAVACAAVTKLRCVKQERGSQQRHAIIRTRTNRTLGLADRAHTSRCRE